MKIMHKIMVIIIKKIIKKKNNKQKTNTITNKTLITDKTLTVEERTKILIYYIQTMKRLPCLIYSVNITFIKTIRSMSLTYSTSTILFAWKILLFQHGLLLWSSSHKSHCGHSADNVRENVSGYGLGLTVFVLSENYNECFYSC